MKILAILAAVVAIAPALRAQQDIVAVRYREPADVFEILDNVSEWWPEYVEPQYRTAWDGAQLAQPGDSLLFARYRALRNQHFNRAGQNGIGRANLFSSSATLTADSIAAAFYQSESMAGAFDALRGFLPAEDVRFLQTFYEHFRPRTQVLTAQTRAFTTASREATATTIADSQVQNYLRRVSHLFRERMDSIPFVALYVWWPDTANTRATPGSGPLILRVRPPTGETMNSADVVAHEAVHAFAAQMNDAQQQQLSREFTAGCKVPDKVRRLGVLEEPLATALGNIEFRRRFMPSRFSWTRRWYGDSWIDISARLLHPLLVERLESGRPLDAAFTKGAAAVCAALVGAVAP